MDKGFHNTFPITLFIQYSIFYCEEMIKREVKLTFNGSKIAIQFSYSHLISKDIWNYIYIHVFVMVLIQQPS